MSLPSLPENTIGDIMNPYKWTRDRREEEEGRRRTAAAQGGAEIVIDEVDNFHYRVVRICFV
jgi:hypothetical protein